MFEILWVKRIKDWKCLFCENLCGKFSVNIQTRLIFVKTYKRLFCDHDFSFGLFSLLKGTLLAPRKCGFRGRCLFKLSYLHEYSFKNVRRSFKHSLSLEKCFAKIFINNEANQQHVCHFSHSRGQLCSIESSFPSFCALSHATTAAFIIIAGVDQRDQPNTRSV